MQLVVALRPAADDDEPRVVEVVQHRHRLHEQVQPFQRLDSSHREHDVGLPYSQRPPRLVARNGPEQVEVDSGGDCADRARRDSVQAGQVVLLLVGGDHHGAGALDHAGLRPHAKLRLELARAGLQLLSGQRVERRDMGHAPGLRERQRRLAREPVVGMHDVVRQPLGRAELLQPLQVLGYVAVQALLGLVDRARTEVDDAGIVAQVDDLWVVRVVRPGVDIDGVSAGAELPGYLEHVHVHAARILPAEAGHGTAVHAQHGYSIHEALRCAGRAGEAGRTGCRRVHGAGGEGRRREGLNGEWSAGISIGRRRLARTCIARRLGESRRPVSRRRSPI